jgi:hypothetical protein
MSDGIHIIIFYDDPSDRLELTVATWGEVMYYIKHIMNGDGIEGDIVDIHISRTL